MALSQLGSKPEAVHREIGKRVSVKFPGNQIVCVCVCVCVCVYSSFEHFTDHPST